MNCLIGYSIIETKTKFILYLKNEVRSFWTENVPAAWINLGNDCRKPTNCFKTNFGKKELVEERKCFLWVLPSRRSLERMINSTAFSVVEAIGVNTEKKSNFMCLYLQGKLIKISNIPRNKYLDIYSLFSLLFGKYFSTYVWFVLTETTLPFLLHANRAIFKTPKSSYWKTNQQLALWFLKTYSIERVTCWARKSKRSL